MNAIPSDALVFFGAMGDLAYKKIFPSLHEAAWVTRSPRLDGLEGLFASRAELVHTSSQPPFLLPLRACPEVCTSSCCPYEISRKLPKVSSMSSDRKSVV